MNRSKRRDIRNAKPHIFLYVTIVHSIRYACMGRGVSACGPTPCEAYRRWAAPQAMIQPIQPTRKP